MTTTVQSSSIASLGHTAAPFESVSLMKRARRRFLRHRMAVIGMVLLGLVFLFVSVGALLFSERDANFNDTKRRLLPPSAEHPLGTDDIGRDILARSIYGGQISILIGVAAVLVSVSLGTLVGLLSGYYGGWLDAVLMRVTEAMLSIPTILLLLVMANTFSNRIPTVVIFGRSFSGSVIVIILIIGATSWMYLSRIVRSNVLSLRESEYVLAARALGAQDRRILFSHILPNTLAPVIVAATLGVAQAILQEAYISFLGMGVQAPTATWGNMLQESREYIDDAPWLWLVPSLLILMTVMGINFVGDGLRDAFDPRSDKKV